MLDMTLAKKYGLKPVFLTQQIIKWITRMVITKE